ncbi:MAG: pirin family protein [Bacteroidia bacterium]|nr:pirin family protein [Bacteroidia bacterium]
MKYFKKKAPKLILIGFTIISFSAFFSFIKKENKMIHISRASEQRIINQGKFIIRLLPLGKNIPNHKDNGIYQIGRIDHATLEGGTFVPMHLHHNDEILSYLRKGKMVHKDSNGNVETVHSKHLMMMNSGSGFYHEEGVPEDGETVEMLQIFMRPRADELPPKVQFTNLPESHGINKWRLIGGNEKSDAPLKINTDVLLYDATIEKGKVALPALSGKSGYLYVFDGNIVIPGKDIKLSKGDAIFFEDEELSVETDNKADLVFFILDKYSAVSKNGLYAH